MPAEDIVWSEYMSDDATLNPGLQDTNRALLSYCSQDVMLGAMLANDTRAFPRSNGATIFIDSIAFLLTVFPAPDRIVFAAVSSGGLGMVANLNALLATDLVVSGPLATASMLLVLDSSMFFNHRSVMQTYLSENDVVDFWRVPSADHSPPVSAAAWQAQHYSHLGNLCATLDNRTKLPCCLTPCALERLLDTHTIPTLVMMSAYDPVTLFFGLDVEALPFSQFSLALKNEDVTNVTALTSVNAVLSGLALLEEAAGFARAEMDRLWQIHPTLSLAMTSCMQHGLAVIVTGEAPPESDVNGLALSSSLNGWQRWTINGQTLASVFYDFVNNPSRQRRHQPSCLGLGCEPSCDSIIDWNHFEGQGGNWRDDSLLKAVCGTLLILLLGMWTVTIVVRCTLRSLNIFDM
jgi:hypothetical protein